MTITANNSPITTRGLSSLFKLPDTRGGGPRGPHPGDILYWFTCVGAACLFLLATT